MKFFDSHCHIHTLKDPIRAHEEANKNNVTYFNIFNIDEWDNIESFCKMNPLGHWAIGVHPLHTKNLHNQLESLITPLEQCLSFSENAPVRGKYLKNLMAIGETGLDAHYGENIAEQTLFFKAHIELAEKFKKPLVIHSRNIDVGTILNLIPTNVSFVFHCCTYDWSDCIKIIQKGGYISFSGLITFSKNEYLRKSASVVPMNKILLETDSPFLSPEPYRGKENHPSYILETYKCLAKIKHLDLKEVCDQVEQNYRNFYKIV